MNKRVAIIVILAVIAAGIAWHQLSGANGLLEVYGTIEARNIEVGSKEGGRIAEVNVREGDAIAKNTLILRFDAQELEGRLQQATSAVALARANLAKMETGSRPEDIAEARAAAGTEATGFRSAEVAQSLDLSLYVISGGAQHESKECHPTLPGEPTNYSEVQECGAAVGKDEQVTAMKVAMKDPMD